MCRCSLNTMVFFWVQAKNIKHTSCVRKIIELLVSFFSLFGCSFSIQVLYVTIPASSLFSIICSCISYLTTYLIIFLSCFLFIMQWFLYIMTIVLQYSPATLHKAIITQSSADTVNSFMVPLCKNKDPKWLTVHKISDRWSLESLQQTFCRASSLFSVSASSFSLPE